MINTVLFDLDGTLTDSRLGITRSAAYALEDFGITVNNYDELNGFVGPPIRWSFKEFTGFDDATVEKVVQKFRERYFVTGVYENEMYPGIDTVLQELKNDGKTLMVATAKVKSLADMVLSHFNIAQYFDYVSGSEMDGTRSEKSEIIRYAMEQNNIIDVFDCIMVGDRKHDIIGAKSVNMKSIGILYGYGSKEELTEAGADYIINTVEELPAFILGL